MITKTGWQAAVGVLFILAVGVASGWFAAGQFAVRPDSRGPAGPATATVTAPLAFGVPATAVPTPAAACESSPTQVQGAARAVASVPSNAPATAAQGTSPGPAPILADATRDAGPPEPPTIGNEPSPEELVAGQVLPTDSAMMASVVSPEAEAVERETRLASERGAEAMQAEGGGGLLPHEKP